MQRANHLGRCAGRNEDAVPGDGLQLRQAQLGDARHAGEDVEALARHDGERTQAPGAHRGEHDLRHDERGAHLPGLQVGELGVHALVGHFEEPRAALELQHLAHELAHAARPVGRIGELLRIRACVVEVFGQRVRRHGRIHHHDERRHGKARDRQQLGPEPAASIRVDDIGHGVVDEREEERVAIRRRLRRLAGRDQAVRAGTVLDDDRLPERFRELRRDLARADVRRAAGDGRYDDAQRPDRKLCSGDARVQRHS